MRTEWTDDNPLPASKSLQRDIIQNRNSDDFADMAEGEVRYGKTGDASLPSGGDQQYFGGTAGGVKRFVMDGDQQVGTGVPLSGEPGDPVDGTIYLADGKVLNWDPLGYAQEVPYYVRYDQVSGSYLSIVSPHLMEAGAPNLLFNPTFALTERDYSGVYSATTGTKPFYDRWHYRSLGNCTPNFSGANWQDGGVKADRVSTYLVWSDTGIAADAANRASIEQRIPVRIGAGGLTVTFSLMLKSPDAAEIMLGYRIFRGQSGTPRETDMPLLHIGSVPSTWTQYIVTMPIPSQVGNVYGGEGFPYFAPVIYACMGSDGAQGAEWGSWQGGFNPPSFTLHVANCKLEHGAYATPFRQVSKIAERIRCAPYYMNLSGGGSGYVALQNHATYDDAVDIDLPVPLTYNPDSRIIVHNPPRTHLRSGYLFPEADKYYVNDLGTGRGSLAVRISGYTNLSNYSLGEGCIIVPAIPSDPWMSTEYEIYETTAETQDEQPNPAPS